jgi:sigma-E factor negative regulatory protein RseB
MKRVCCLLFSLLSYAALAAPVAPDQAAAWLDKMSHAVKETDYQGVLVFGDSRAWQTLSISHMVVEGIEYEKIVHLTGEEREIVRVGHETTCTHPGDHAVRSHAPSVGSLASAVRDNISQIQKHYQLGMAGKGRVAGRAVVVVDVAPWDRHRYGHRLWLDKTNGLLLRSDLLDAQQRVLERYQFASIEVGKRLPFSEFDASGRGHRIAPHLESAVMQPLPDGMNWRPGWVPTGFSRTGQTYDQQRVSAMYTDGLAAFSVFVEAVTQHSMTDVENRWGATSAVVVHRQEQGREYRITLVGEWPLPTARKIAHSVAVPGAES